MAQRSGRVGDEGASQRHRDCKVDIGGGGCMAANRFDRVDWNWGGNGEWKWIGLEWEREWNGDTKLGFAKRVGCGDWKRESLRE